MLSGHAAKWYARENKGGLESPAITVPPLFNSKVVKLDKSYTGAIFLVRTL